MLRLFIADDHAVIRQGIRRALTDVTIVGEASSARELLQRLPHQMADVLLLDLSLPDQHGVQVIPKVKALSPNTRIIIFSMFAEPDYARFALQAGATGYVLKTAPMKELRDAIRQVVAGNLYLSPPFDELDLHMSAANGKRLSPREDQILQLIADGKTMREIAVMLEVSPKTIAAYRTRLLEKLQLTSTSALIRYAVSSRSGKFQTGLAS